MNRRHLLQTLIAGGGATLLAPRRKAAALPQGTIDMLSGAYSDLPFRPNSPGYISKGWRERFVWALGTLRTPRKVLFQAAVQSPAYFFIFKYDNAFNTTTVPRGTVPPSIWNTGTRRRWEKVNYVSQYLDLPAGTYVFMGQDETLGTETNECSMSIRDMVLPGQQLSYTFVDSQPLLDVATENTEKAIGPFQVINAQNEVYYLRGCVNESSAGQVVEVLFEPQYLLWKQKRPYTVLATLAHHFHSQYIFGATNTKWYLILKNAGRNPVVNTNSPVSLSYVWERWRRA
ncbi:MAG: hypothetical protein JWM21_3425 [Acidobacteria bacterium]|nr:hypothetical protein [Acidobacteriota bacterium]